MSRRHLSSLKRGMDALTVLAMSGRITAAELGKRIKVPRTTAHRILDTLVSEGYVLHNPHNHCFQLSKQVRQLASSASRDEVISQVARPILRDLCREILLAVGLITPVGRELMLQVAMDLEAPLSENHLPEGFFFPVTFGACGRLFLAHCSESVRKEFIAEALASQPSYLTAHHVPSAPELDHILQAGYCVSAKPGAPHGVLAVPVYFRGDYAASLHIRFTNHEAATAEAVERYLARLQRAACEVEQALIAATSADLGASET